MKAKSSSKMNANRIFFPAAAVHGGLTVLLTLFAKFSGTGFPAGLIGIGHAHEMLFGFVLALIAGYTLGSMPYRKLGLLFSLWLSARISFTFFPETLISQLLSPAYALLLAFFVFPRYRSAKKWRNKMISPLILAICSFPLIWLTLKLTGWPISSQAIYISLILFLCLLMSSDYCTCRRRRML